MTKRQLELTIHEMRPALEAEDFRAIGKLASWSIGSAGLYAGKCNIYCDHNGDINAVYRNLDGDCTYTIFAQRGADGFSFNS